MSFEKINNLAPELDLPEPKKESKKITSHNLPFEIQSNMKAREQKDPGSVNRRNFLKTSYTAAFGIGIGLGALHKEEIALQKQALKAGREVRDFTEEDSAVEPVEQVHEDVESEEVKEDVEEQAVEEISDERKFVEWQEFKKMRPDVSYEENYVPEIKNLKFPDVVGKYGAVSHEGKIMRTLRYRNVTEAVEEKYNLPPGILMAMIMEESTGVDLLPNARGDGGFGLSHMQGSTATEYGLKTFCGCNSLVCGPKKNTDGKIIIAGCKDEKGEPLNHGKKLAEFMKENTDNREALVEADDRLHVLLNIDAAGRMLAAGIGGPKINGLGSLRTAICRYSGRHNYEAYWKDIKRNMRDITDSTMIDKVSELFDSVNADLKIDGESSDFAGYLKSCYMENENYDLEKYKKMPKYKPLNSDGVLSSYKDFIKE